MKERLDVLLVKRNLASSREKAKAIIMSGNVFVDGQREDKAGTSFSEEVKIEVRGHALPYVSRGGLKLEKAMKNFDVSMEGKVCTDVGSSTGGFTDCMLCKMEQSRCLPSMWDMVSWTGNYVRMKEWSAWKRPISVMYSRKIWENRLIFHQLMFLLFR